MPRQNFSAVPTWRAAGLTDVGRTRTCNEDAFALERGAGILVVADGIGGHQAGAVASRFVTALALSLLKSQLEAGPRAAVAAVRTIVRDVILEAGRRLRLEAAGRPELHGMGTTIVLVCLRGDRAIIGNMGDSRAYMCRRGRLRCLTSDHSLVALLLRRGEISADEALTHPARGKVSRYVGMDGDVLPDVRTVPLAAGDRLLLCTDGLNGMVEDAAIGTIVKRKDSPETVCRALIEAANARGGHDNVTVIVADCHASSSRRGG